MTPVARVRPVELDLLTIARALFEPRQHAVVAPLLRTARPLGPAIGRTSMGVLEDTLAKGLVRMAARDVASAVEPLPRAPSLHVSSGSFRFLHWLAEAPLAAPEVPSLEVDDEAPQTPADQLLVILGLELARSAAVLQTLLAQSWVQRAPLAWLYATDDLARVALPRTAPDLDAVALLPRTLAARLQTVERAKALQTSPAERARIGRAQASLFDSLVPAAIAGRRWDSLRFLLDGVMPLLRVEPTVWAAPLDPQSALSARAEARRLAVAPLRAVGTIGATHARLRLVGFVDDEYDEAQKTLRLLAPWGDVFARAEAQVRAAEGLEDL